MQQMGTAKSQRMKMHISEYVPYIIRHILKGNLTSLSCTLLWEIHISILLIPVQECTGGILKCMLQNSFLTIKEQMHVLKYI